jgi:hypothetical protein
MKRMRRTLGSIARSGVTTFDVFVKASRGGADKPKSLIYGPLPRYLLCIENRRDGWFFGKAL